MEILDLIIKAFRSISTRALGVFNTKSHKPCFNIDSFQARSSLKELRNDT